ncbi:MAG: alkaline phosphatase family protein [Myxococcota bacterium]|jgi:predicted AlkP superfamily pyrophosphatase or phosphodiesterase
MRRLALLLTVALSFPAAAKPPRLTLVISVDSLGTEVVQRSRGKFKSGLARLNNEGAVFPVMRYDVAECVTGAGHATLASGAWADRHGVVGNKLFNRATGKLEPVFSDPSHPVLEAPLGNEDTSPANLLADTLSDRVRASTMLRGKAIAISGKPRAAIAMAGRLGEAWWFHEQVGRFVTGTWYRKEFPTWVKTFNDKKLPDGFHAKKWELLGPPKDYLGEDERPFESDWYGLGKTFPHPLSGGVPSPGPQSYSALASSPMMYEVLVPFVKAAIDGEQLGKDDVPDLLSLSLSPLDRTYHLYGPTSWEMQDHLLRLDKALGEIISYAERAAGGKGNLVVVVTGDHGGANIPEEWASQGLDAARVPPASLIKGVNEELEKRFGVQSAVAAIEEVDVYLDTKALEGKKVDPAQVRRAAAAWLAKQPDLHLAVARDDLWATPGNGTLRALRNGFHPERSGDVLIVMKPFHVLESEAKGTSHGTPWSYDAEVPLYLFGRGVRPGQYAVVPQAIDVAPTVADLMELGAPAMSEGRPLAEALNLPR